MSRFRNSIKNMSGILGFESYRRYGRRGYLSIEELQEEVAQDMADVQEEQANLDVASDAMDTLTEDQATVSNVQEIVDDSIESGEGLSETSAELVQEAVESIMRRHGMPRRTWPSFPSKESFSSSRSRLEATRRLKISIEEGVFKKIGSSLKKLWEKIKEFFRKLWDKLFGGSSNTKDLLEEAKEKFEQLKKDNKNLVTLTGNHTLSDITTELKELFDDKAVNLGVAELDKQTDVFRGLAKQLKDYQAYISDPNNKANSYNNLSNIQGELDNLDPTQNSNLAKGQQRMKDMETLFGEIDGAKNGVEFFDSNEKSIDNFIKLITDLGGKVPEEKDHSALVKNLDEISKIFADLGNGTQDQLLTRASTLMKTMLDLTSKSLTNRSKICSKIAKLISDVANESSK